MQAPTKVAGKQNIPLKNGNNTGGGSAPSPQARRMHAGSAKATSSKPPHPQRLRG